MTEFKKEKLIERELEIGSYLLQGRSQKQIAEKTGLHKKTISAHMHNMMKKLKANNTAELLKLLHDHAVDPT